MADIPSNNIFFAKNLLFSTFNILLENQCILLNFTQRLGFLPPCVFLSMASLDPTEELPPIWQIHWNPDCLNQLTFHQIQVSSSLKTSNLNEFFEFRHEFNNEFAKFWLEHFKNFKFYRVRVSLKFKPLNSNFIEFEI